MLDILSYCAYTIRAVAKQTVTWGLSSAGRASALQAEGHRFEPYRPHTHGGIAQLARAHGSYPWCRWFESNFRYERYSESYISFLLFRELSLQFCRIFEIYIYFRSLTDEQVSPACKDLPPCSKSFGSRVYLHGFLQSKLPLLLTIRGNAGSGLRYLNRPHLHFRQVHHNHYDCAAKQRHADQLLSGTEHKPEQIGFHQ